MVALLLFGAFGIRKFYFETGHMLHVYTDYTAFGGGELVF